jgi:hypothetical protein
VGLTEGTRDPQTLASLLAHKAFRRRERARMRMDDISVMVVDVNPNSYIGRLLLLAVFSPVPSVPLSSRILVRVAAFHFALTFPSLVTHLIFSPSTIIIQKVNFHARNSLSIPSLTRRHPLKLSPLSLLPFPHLSYLHSFLVLTPSLPSSPSPTTLNSCE